MAGNQTKSVSLRLPNQVKLLKPDQTEQTAIKIHQRPTCLLYTSDAADE